MHKNGVNEAFEILLEEIEEVFNILSKEGEEAFKDHDFDKAKSLIENAERLKMFREKLKSLQKEWQTIFSENVSVPTRKREIKSKLKKGLRTSQEEFIIPILESLIELGGKVKVENVLDKVYEKMKDRLNWYDLEGLPSKPKEERWKNTAKWARKTMVNEGLLLSDSPRGIWEISEKGIRFYNQKK